MWRNSLEEKTSHVRITVRASVQLQLPTGLRHIQSALQNSMTYFETACGKIATLVLSNRSSCYLHCSPGWCQNEVIPSPHPPPPPPRKKKEKKMKLWVIKLLAPVKTTCVISEGAKKPSSGSSSSVTDNEIGTNWIRAGWDHYACRLSSSMVTISAENNSQTGHIII